MHEDISSPASVRIGAVGADGTLSLKDGQLRFEPFSARPLLGPYTIPLDSIASVKPVMGKGAGILPITSDALLVTTTNGKRYHFIVAEPDYWIAQLKA